MLEDKSSIFLRESFLKFFESKGHLRLPSFSLIPLNDPTLLLIGAGMAPFKPFFKGEETPPSNRLVTCQKCVRADDILCVGKTSRHHTFFEMLGNFSIGDYYKEEAILWAWEYLTDIIKLPKERLWITIHPEDQETFKIWNEKVGLPKEKIICLKDNFWGPIGASGPCGPCSEVCYDRGEEFSCKNEDCLPGCDCDRFIELWNLVFTGLNKTAKGEYLPLPKPCIDTGLGLERLVMIIQEKNNPFETDLFMPLIKKIGNLAPVSMGKDSKSYLSVKIIADHLRALVFMLSDGIVPGNIGRGYVARRILRRAVRFGKILGIEEIFLEKLAPAVIQDMQTVYLELKEKKDFICEILNQEEKLFSRTLTQGENLLFEEIKKIASQKEKKISGEIVFKLYDTYGFPWELTQEIAQESGLEIEEEKFKILLEEQKERSRKDLKEKVSQKILEEEPQIKFKQEFVGYEKLVVQSKIIDWQESKEGLVIFLNPTPFYAESGGQVGDSGFIEEGGNLIIEVIDTKLKGEVFYHLGKILKGELKKDSLVTARVDKAGRLDIMRHHTATHLLQSSLREILGKHISQAGSFVSRHSLRFDFTHPKALTQDEILKIQNLVNHKIFENLKVVIKEMSLEEAKKRGALAFFGEKYAKIVRLVEINDFSKELCGGTHVKSTKEIESFIIVSESAIGAGLRRIEAMAGNQALLDDYLVKEEILKELSNELKCNSFSLPLKLKDLKEELKFSQKKIEELKKNLAYYKSEDLIKDSEKIKETNLISAFLENSDTQDLKLIIDSIKSSLNSAIVILAGGKPEQLNFLAYLSQDLIAKGFSAKVLLGEFSAYLGGKSGGRDDQAQGGGGDYFKIKEGLLKIKEIIKDKI